MSSWNRQLIFHLGFPLHSCECFLSGLSWASSSHPPKGVLPAGLQEARAALGLLALALGFVPGCPEVAVDRCCGAWRLCFWALLPSSAPGNLCHRYFLYVYAQGCFSPVAAWQPQGFRVFTCSWCVRNYLVTFNFSFWKTQVFVKSC